jgi:peptidoglycan/xylan/chitin deacetylase (PgdA/CDA1 family)
MHRVSEQRRPTDAQPYLTIAPQELDALIELMLSARPDGEQGWLTVTFDDGYEDALEYVRSRAERFPKVEFLFFVCPEKSKERVGFRWDLEEEKAKAAQAEALRVLDSLDVTAENRRPELRGLSDRSEYKLADLEALKALKDHENVDLGNHTNCHFKQTHLSEEQARTEYERSKQIFDRLFGEQRHFAFPFGTPGHEFDASHVRLLREQGRFLIWSTERRPYKPNERHEGAVLPRFPVNGTWSHRSIAAWIAARSLIYRLRGTKHRF